MDQTTPSTPNQQPEQPKSSAGKIIGSVVALVIVLGLVGFFMIKKEKPEVKSSNETSEQLQKEGSSVQPMSLKELMTGGKTQKCIFSATSDSGSNQGSVYIENGKMRGDFTTTVNGKAMGGHMINDGKYIYSWSDEQKMGAKMAIDSMAKMHESMPEPTGQAQVKTAVDENAKYSYNCSAWTADSAQFTPPSDVKFIDPSEMMSGLKTSPTDAKSGQYQAEDPGSGGYSKEQLCNSCNQAGENKAQCLVAMGCNK